MQLLLVTFGDPMAWLKPLILDDSEAICFAFSIILEDQGLTALSYQCPFQAIERIREGGIDLLITDYQMPSLSGPAVAAALREVGWAGDIILMSAIERGLHSKEMERLKISEFFVKSPNNLRACLRRHLN